MLGILNCFTGLLTDFVILCVLIPGGENSKLIFGNTGACCNANVAVKKINAPAIRVNMRYELNAGRPVATGFWDLCTALKILTYFCFAPRLKYFFRLLFLYTIIDFGAAHI